MVDSNQAFLSYQLTMQEGPRYASVTLATYDRLQKVG